MTHKKRSARGSNRKRLTHFDMKGRARMVDVGGKPLSRREAIASGTIAMNARAYRAVESGTVAKGDVGALSRVAGIAAAKRTADLIPLCHSVPLVHVTVDVRLDSRARSVTVQARARTRWSTGVEMEALVAVVAALLTVYDTAKALDRGMVIGPIRLLHKSGGRSGVYTAPATAPRVRR